MTKRDKGETPLYKYLVYLLPISWYGYVFRIIGASKLPLFMIIILYISGMILTFFSCVGIHKYFSEDDK
jgi:hypothetical protein